MSVTQRELDRFHQFVSQHLQNGATNLSLEEILGQFRAYQDDVARLHRELQQSIEEGRRGEARPLDVDELMAEVREELAEEGITD